MKEQGEIKPDILIEEINELVRYLGDSTLDSPKGQAFIDERLSARLYEEKHDQLENLEQATPGTRDYRRAESDLRITETRIAIAHDRIDTRSLNPEYQEAYGHLGEQWDGIGEAVFNVSDAKFPTDEKQRAQLFRDTINEIVGNTTQILVDNSSKNQNLS